MGPYVNPSSEPVPENDPQTMRLLVNPGRATEDEVAPLLPAISGLNQAYGGEALNYAIRGTDAVGTVTLDAYPVEQETVIALSQMTGPSARPPASQAKPESNDR